MDIYWPVHCHGTYIYVAKTTIPVAKDVYIRPTSISFLCICQSQATDVVFVACLRCVFFVSWLIAACSLGPCSLRKQLILLCFAWFCPNGRKQRCGCSQMRHKLVRAVRLMAFMTTVIDLASFGWKLGRREWRWRLAGRGNYSDGGSWRIKMTTLLWRTTSMFWLAVNARLRRGCCRYECTSIVTSETLRVSCLESGEIQSGSAASKRW